MAHEASAGVYLGTRRVGTLGYRGGVPEWFANLLPEPGSGLRELIAKELDKKRVHDFLLLTYLGEDLPGAVRIDREGNGREIPELIEPDRGMRDHPLRFSLAGVQPKFSMRYEGKGLVLPASGLGGDWIVKLPDRRFPQVPENEHAMLTWAALAGIDVPEHLLVAGTELHGLPEGLIQPEEYALAVRRFDRLPDGRVHQEDFAQVREVVPDAKYDRATYGGLGRVVSELAPADLDEFIRRLAALVIMGNTDAHLKNWTFRYPDGRTARLSPAYDLVSVTAYPRFRNDRLAFGLGENQDPRQISTGHFRRIATVAGIAPDSAADSARGTAFRLAESWSEVVLRCPVPDFVREHVAERLRELPLLDA